MKAITLWQPWATLIAIGAKRFETRSWATRYRGPLAIHASTHLVLKTDLTPPIGEALAPHGFYRPEDLPMGCVVCVVDLVEVDHTRSVMRYSDFGPNEAHFGDYSYGRFAWRLANLRRVNNIPAKGAQGLWNWTPPEGFDL